MNSLPPQETWLSATRTRVSNRLARSLLTTPLQLKGDAAMVSFTFDDIPDSAATVAAPMIADHGGRASFYVASGLLGRWSGFWQGATDDQVVALHRAGHEIGCHTFAHRRISDLGGADLAAEFDANRTHLEALDPSIRLANFAYPYGVASIGHKPRLRRGFRSARGIFPGINAGTIDLHNLRALPLISIGIDAAAIDRAFDDTVRSGGWLIFYGHDVAPAPSDYGCTPDLLRHAIRAAVTRQIPMLPVNEALSRLAA